MKALRNITHTLPHRGIHVILAGALGLSNFTANPSHAAYNTTPTRKEKSPSLSINVTVSPSLSDAHDLRIWIEDESDKILDALPEGIKYHGKIQIDIEGEMYNYHARASASRNGQRIGEHREWTCECDQEKLLTQVRSNIRPLVQLLESRPAAEKESALLPRPAPPASSKRHPRTEGKRKLSWTEWTGLVFIGSGSAGIAAGSVLFFVNGEQTLRDPNPEFIIVRDYRVFGSPAIAAGASLLAAGIIVFTIDRIHSKRKPNIKPHTHLTLSPGQGGGIRLPQKF